MTPKELLAREPESVENDFDYLVGYRYNFVPEALDQPNLLVETTSERVEIRIFKHFDFDYRRFWRLAAVYFDGKPVMITQNAGREGDDHAHRYLLDESVYRELIGYLASRPRKPQVYTGIEVDKKHSMAAMDEDLGDKLTTFYNDTLDGGFIPNRIW